MAKIDNYTATPIELRQMLSDLYNALEEEIVRGTIKREALDNAYFTFLSVIEARERR